MQIDFFVMVVNVRYVVTWLRFMVFGSSVRLCNPKFCEHNVLLLNCFGEFQKNSTD